MTDNFDQIVKLLKFESEDEFYYIQILVRSKENPELGRNSNLIGTYHSQSLVVTKTPL